jgi:hypothetical protein
VPDTRRSESSFRNGVIALLAVLLLPWCTAAWAAAGQSGAEFHSRVLDWLLSPISGAVDHRISVGTYLHGRLMVLAWGIFVPVSILLARFYKVTPGQDWPRVLNNPFWFNSHRAVGWGAGALMIAGVVLIVLDDPGRAPWRSFHAALGWTVIVAGLLQLFSSHARGAMGGPSHPVTRAPLRNWQWKDVADRDPADPDKPRSQWPGDHFNMTRTRVLYEYVHKTLGYLLLALSAVALVSGLLAADALNWMWVTLLLWWLACGAVFIVMQRQGRCIDCYQAIWGVEEHLPGNRLQPIGWGIRRYTPQTVEQATWPRREGQNKIARSRWTTDTRARQGR